MTLRFIMEHILLGEDIFQIWIRRLASLLLGLCKR